MSLVTVVAEIVRPYFQSIGEADANEACARVLLAVRHAGAGVKTIAVALEADDLTATNLPPALRKALAARIREDATSPVEITGEKRLCLRPESFEDVIGHQNFKELMCNAITAAKIRRTTLRHILLSGPRGLGKTTLALVIAHELKTSVRLLVGTQLRTPVDVTAEVLNWQTGQVIFIDEIHGLSNAAQETLYSVMEDGRVPISERRQGRKERTSVPAAQVTIIGATTNPSRLLEPFRNRFGLQHELSFYTSAEMEEIGHRSARILDLALEPNAMRELVAHARNNPRTLNELLIQLGDMRIAKDLTRVDTEIVAELLRLNEYDAQGLRKVERRYLDALTRMNGVGSLGTLAKALDMEETEVELSIEPWLIRQGHIRKTSRGRQLVTSVGGSHGH